MTDNLFLSIVHLCKSYPLDKKRILHALKDISLDIQRGEFIVLLGPSGSGKSTLLHIIAGLESADSGQIMLGHHNISTLPPQDREMSIVFQNYVLYPHLCVYDNLAYPLKTHKLPQNIIRARIEKTASLLGIESLLERHPSQLSGGQQQRVAIARAMVKEPQVYLFDEPLSNLDSRLKDKMRREIKNLHKSLGSTMIYVTHDQLEAMSLATRIVILNEGQIEQIGTPQDIYLHPASVFVADFLGFPSINLLTITSMTDVPQFQNLNLESLLQQYPQGLILGIRPECLYLESENNQDLALQMIPTSIETMGAYQICYLDLQGQELRMTMTSQTDQQIMIGQKQLFYVKTAHILLYDKKTKLLLGYLDNFC